MKIDSSLVGRELAGLKHEVNWRETMNYAAAVGDANPRYFDDTSQNGIVAPPLYVVAVTWPFIENVQIQLGNALPPEVYINMVHATEHIVFHRPIRPGDRLDIAGEVAAVLPSLKGTLMVLKLEATDSDGQKVFTEFGGAFFRGIGGTESGRGKENLPVLPRWKIPSVPQWSVEIPTRQEAAHVYDGCTNIVFAIHTSSAFARSVGLPDAILQGTATLAMAAREIVNQEAGSDPTRLREISCRFSGMVTPGTSIRVELLQKEEGPEGKLLSFRVLNAEGRPALQKGFVRIA